MASMGMQMLAGVLCLLGWAGVIFSCILPMWRVTAFVGTSIVTAQIIWEGIWMACVSQSTGHLQCKPYESMLALTSDLQAARGFMVLAIATGGMGLILAFFGGKCTKFLDEEGSGAKDKLALSAGAVLMATGLFCLIPTMWTAGVVVQTFYSTTTDSQRRELGASLYIGWLASILLIFGGGLFLKSACPLKAHGTGKRSSARYVAPRSSNGSTRTGSYHSRVTSTMSQPMSAMSSRSQSSKGATTKPQLYTRPPSEGPSEQNSREGSRKSWAPSTKSKLGRTESLMSDHSEALSTKSQLKGAEEMEETLSANRDKEDASSNPSKTYL